MQTRSFIINSLRVIQSRTASITRCSTSTSASCIWKTFGRSVSIRQKSNWRSGFTTRSYNTSKKDNEKRSAEWARDSLLAAGVSREPAERVYGLVMVTMHDAVPAGTDAQVLVDIDLGILGAEAVRFDEYELQVREEYSWVPEPLYRAARRKVLEQFARREWIYSTAPFRSEYEPRARENITRSLARL